MTLTSRSLRDRPSRNRTRTLWAFSLRYMRSSKRRTTRNYKTSRARRAPGRVRSGRAPRHPRCGNGAGTARDLPRHVPRPPAQCIGICSRGWRIEDARGQASPRRSRGSRYGPWIRSLFGGELVRARRSKGDAAKGIVVKRPQPKLNRDRQQPTAAMQRQPFSTSNHGGAQNMSNYSPRHSDLLARIRGYLEEAKVQLQQARTKEERNLLNEKIGFFERRQHEVRVAGRG